MNGTRVADHSITQFTIDSPGTYAIVVRSANLSSGAFTARFQLIGDVDSNGRSTLPMPTLGCRVQTHRKEVVVTW